MRAIGKKSVCYLVIFALIISAFFSVPVYRVKAAVAVTGISLAVTNFEMALPANAGDTISWPNNYWTISPSDATNKNVTVESSNPKVVTAVQASANSNKLYVEAVGVGTATVTVTTQDGGYSATCKITVKGPKVSSLEWVDYPGRSGGMPYIQVGTTHSTKVAVKVSPSNAEDQRVEITSKPEGILSIDSSGNVTALKAGEAYIVATAMDGSGVSIESNKITAWGEAEEIQTQSLAWNQSASTLTVGESSKFKVRFTPENVTNKTLKWSSTIPAYATVDQTGTVTAVAPGTTTITATAQDGSGKKVTQKLKVEAAEPEVESVSITAPSATVEKGGSVQLTASVTPSGADQGVTWSSDNESVATVDENGVVTARAKGNAKISATSIKNPKIKSNELDITVTVTPTGLTLSTTTLALNKGDTKQLTATIAPEDADAVIVWESSDEKVATVDSTGLVKAVAFGNAVITATCKNTSITAKCNVSVPTPVTGIAITESVSALTEGESITFKAELVPSTATDKTITWNSSNPSVATVEEATGKISAVSAGTTEITATSGNGISSSPISLTVIKKNVELAVEEVLITAENTTVEKGKTVQIEHTVKPSEADSSVTWDSDNESVAIVDENGVVTAKAKGSATITATSIKNPKIKSNELAITVTVTPTGLTLSTTTLSLNKGDTKQLKATIAPEDADAVVIWESSDEKVATVDSTGLVKAVASGNAIITATCKNTSITAKCVVSVPTPVTGIAITESVSTLTEGESITFKAELVPSIATDKTITWNSSNPSVATVEEATGKISAVSAGTTEITATSRNGISSSPISLTVIKKNVELAVEEVLIAAENTTVEKGKTVQINHAVKPSGADPNVTWSSDNESVATVDENGVVTAKTKGSAIITATSIKNPKIKSNELAITVTVTPTGLTLSTTTLDLNKDDKYNLTAKVAPEGADQSVKWESSNESVATVSSTGLVTAVATGSATITATDIENKELFESCAITVTTPVDSIAWKYTVDQMTLGEEKEFVVKVTPQAADDKKIKFVSSDPLVVEVVEVAEYTVKVKATGGGSATITARSEGNPSIEPITCDVTVNVPVDGISLERENLVLTLKTQNAEVSETVSYTVLPADATNKKVSCSSNHPEIATAIIENGKLLIKAEAVGDALISVITDDGGCNKECAVTVKGVPVSTIKFKTCPDKLKVNESSAVTVEVLPSDAGNAKVEYTCSPSDVASVKDGKIYGLKEGTVTLTAAATDESGVKATKTITVEAGDTPIVEVVGLEWDEKDNIMLLKGKEYQLSASVLPKNATDPSIIWTSSNPEVVSVDQNGLLKAVGKGYSLVTAKSNANEDIFMTHKVTVTVPVEKIAWENENKTTMSLNKGDSKQLTVVVTPAEADDQTVTYFTSDSKVVNVDQKGNISAVGNGSAVVKAVSNDNANAIAQMNITVSTPVTGISVSKAEVTLLSGKTQTITATLDPKDNTDDKTISWTSDNPSVATVEDGVIKAVKSGTAVITAKHMASGKYATVTVTVNPILVSSITLGNTDIQMRKGQSSQKIQYDILPKDAEDKSVSIISNNENVVKVDPSTGELTATGIGTATVTVTANDAGGVFASAKVTVTEAEAIKKYVEAVNVENTEVALEVGDTTTINATVSPEDATYKDLAYISEDSSVVMVDGNGVIRALSVGSTTVNVMALDNNGKVKSIVHVTVEPKNVSGLAVTLSKTSYIYTGNACKPQVTIRYNDTELVRGKDYTLTYAKYIRAGTATVTVNGIGSFTGSKVISYTIKTRSVSGTTVTRKLKYTSMMYTGKQLKPAVTVKYGTKVLKNGTDYTVTYSKNIKVGTASVVIKGKGNFGGAKTLTFKITKRAITAASVTKIAAKKYTGKAIKPLPVLKYNGKNLKRGTDYKLTYKNNVKVGTATIVVTGIGNFKGTRKITFKIKK